MRWAALWGRLTNGWRTAAFPPEPPAERRTAARSSESGEPPGAAATDTPESGQANGAEADRALDDDLRLLRDVPIPEEAEELNALSTSTLDRIGYLCTFNLRGNAKEAGDYYRRAFRQRSFEYAEYTDGSTVNLMGGNDTYSLLVGIFPNENISERVTVTLTYGVKKAN
ncbi:hypothetical protein [Cohnella hongkongensis]|uniref:Uncharacterized protein n=1 Tax=Cohnella hongkongensis TaxID=178337 RepID=A0ABV9F532_9BACL